MAFKREHKRVEVRLPASFIKKDLPNLVNEIMIWDISAGGLCFESDDMIETKLQVIISLYIKEEDTNINLEGEIMWNRFDDSIGKVLYGIQFTEFSSKDFQIFLGFYCKQILNF